MTVAHSHRIATPEDVHEIFRVITEVAPEIPMLLDTTERQEAIQRMLKECTGSGESLIAIDSEGHVVGFLLVKPEFSNNGLALDLPYAGVTANWRERGVFHTLIRLIMDRNMLVTATINAANRSGMAMRLINLGFQNVGPGFYPNETKFRWQPDQAKPG